MNVIFEFVLRVIGMYFLAMVVIRFMGKRALGELGLFDFVIMTGVGHTLTSIALDRSIPFYEGIVVLVTLAGLEYIMGYASLKSQRLARLISGVPVVVIDNGWIMRENLAREKFNVDDLMQELRKHGIRDVSEVEQGLLEPCGGFSVILKPDFEPVTRGELGIKWEPGPDTVLTSEPVSRKLVLQSPAGDGGSQKRPSVSLADQKETLEAIHKALGDILRRLDELDADSPNTQRCHERPPRKPATDEHGPGTQA